MLRGRTPTYRFDSPAPTAGVRGVLGICRGMSGRCDGRTRPSALAGGFPIQDEAGTERRSLDPLPPAGLPGRACRKPFSCAWCERGGVRATEACPRPGKGTPGRRARVPIPVSGRRKIATLRSSAGGVTVTTASQAESLFGSEAIDRREGEGWSMTPCHGSVRGEDNRTTVAVAVEGFSRSRRGRGGSLFEGEAFDTRENNSSGLRSRVTAWLDVNRVNSSVVEGASKCLNVLQNTPEIRFLSVLDHCGMTGVLAYRNLRERKSKQ